MEAMEVDGWRDILGRVEGSLRRHASESCTVDSRPNTNIPGLRPTSVAIRCAMSVRDTFYFVNERIRHRCGTYASSQLLPAYEERPVCIPWPSHTCQIKTCPINIPYLAPAHRVVRTTACTGHFPLVTRLGSRTRIRLGTIYSTSGTYYP